MGLPESADRAEHSLSSLLARIRAGDDSAAYELTRRYEAQVRLVVRRQLPRMLRSRFDSMDFLQSVWGSFFRRMAADPVEMDEPRSLVAFLARAARNKVIDEYRRAASQKADMSLEEPLYSAGTVVGGEDSPSEIVEAREEFLRLMNLVPEDRRAVLELRVQGLSTREIGEKLGISERTVRRVLEDLRHRSGLVEGEEGGR
ncbi:RNA polymerase sigma factor [Tundrisphaera sp. TA3]|uniref:RNA polymerase sigma factor n=1 Tax=Tundrisphaera sp. TA3 TaxID=3435775 RepID=UPI003EBC5227